MSVSPEAPWFYTAQQTPGESNLFAFVSAIVINEIMYHYPPTYRTTNRPFSENEEQWIELYNKGNAAVDLGPGDFVRYPGDGLHVVERLGKQASLHIVTTVPQVPQFGPEGQPEEPLPA